nr:MAG: hypothetical protein 1 [Dicistroviridae sp.]
MSQRSQFSSVIFSVFSVNFQLFSVFSVILKMDSVNVLSVLLEEKRRCDIVIPDFSSEREVDVSYPITFSELFDDNMFYIPHFERPIRSIRKFCCIEESDKYCVYDLVKYEFSSVWFYQYRRAMLYDNDEEDGRYQFAMTHTWSRFLVDSGLITFCFNPWREDVSVVASAASLFMCALHSYFSYVPTLNDLCVLSMCKNDKESLCELLLMFPVLKCVLSNFPEGEKVSFGNYCPVIMNDPHFTYFCKLNKDNYRSVDILKASEYGWNPGPSGLRVQILFECKVHKMCCTLCKCVSVRKEICMFLDSLKDKESAYVFDHSDLSVTSFYKNSMTPSERELLNSEFGWNPGPQFLNGNTKRDSATRKVTDDFDKFELESHRLRKLEIKKNSSNVDMYVDRAKEENRKERCRKKAKESLLKSIERKKERFYTRTQGDEEWSVNFENAELEIVKESFPVLKKIGIKNVDVILLNLIVFFRTKDYFCMFVSMYNIIRCFMREKIEEACESLFEVFMLLVGCVGRRNQNRWNARATRTENGSKILTAIGEFLYDDLGSLVSRFIIAISGIVLLGKIPKKNDFDSILNRVGRFSNNVTGIENLFVLSGKYVNKVADWYSEKILNKPIVDDFQVHFSELKELVIKYSSKTKESDIVIDSKVISEIDDMYKKSMEVMFSLKDTPQAISYRPYFTLIQSLHKKILNSPIGGSVFRASPVVLCLTGKPGVGKTFLTWLLSMEVIRHYMPEKRFGPGEWASHIFFRLVGNKYWQNYNSAKHLVCVMDDANQIVPDIVDGVPAAGELIYLANNAEMPLDVPELENKKFARFNSKAVIITDNMIAPNLAKIIAEPDAYYRRLDMRVEVSVKPECGKLYRNKQGEEWYTLLKKPKAATELQTDAYQFRLLDAQGEYSDYFGYDVLKEKFKDILVDRHDEFVNFKDQLDVYAESTRVDRTEGWREDWSELQGGLTGFWWKWTEKSVGVFMNEFVLLQPFWLRCMLSPMMCVFGPFKTFKIIMWFNGKKEWASVKSSNVYYKIKSKLSNFSFQGRLLFLCCVPLVLLFLYRLVTKTRRGFTVKGKKYVVDDDPDHDWENWHGDEYEGNELIDYCPDCFDCDKEDYMELYGDECSFAKGRKFCQNCDTEYVNGKYFKRVDCESKIVNKDKLAKKGVKNVRSVKLEKYSIEKDKNKVVKAKVSRSSVLECHVTSRNLTYTESLKDPNTQEIVNHRIFKNLYYCSVEWHEKNLLGSVVAKTERFNVVFIRNRLAFCPRHCFLGLPDDAVVTLSNAHTNYCSSFRFSDLIKVSINVNDFPKDVLVVQFPSEIRQHVNISNYLVTDEEVANFSCSDAVLVGYVNHVLDVPTVKINLVKKVELARGKIANCNGSDLFCPQIVRYDSVTSPGDCGSPLLLVNKFCPHKFLGIHSLGNSLTNVGHSTIVTVEDFLSVLPLFNESQSYVFGEILTLDACNVSEKVDNLPLELSKNNVYIYGSVDKNIFSSSVSQIEEGVLHKVFSEPTTKPAMLRNFVNDKGVKVNVFDKNLSKYFNKVEKISSVDVLNFKRSVKDVVGKIKFVKLSHAESIRGVEGFESLVRKTSPGFPWVLVNKNRGKVDWLGSDEEFEVDNEQLKRACGDYIEKAKQGIVEPIIAMDKLKDERRPIAKVDEGKTRYFSMMPVHYSVVCRQYFYSLINKITVNKIKNGSLVGINPHGCEWNELYNQMRTVNNVNSNCMLAGDYSNFDGSLNAQLLWAMFEGIMECMSLDEGSEDYRVCYCLWLNLVNSFHLHKGIIYQLDHSQPSGNPLTTIINTIYNLALLRVVTVKLVVDQKPELLEKVDYKWFAYGDDNIGVFNHVFVDNIDVSKISEVMKEFGHDYTDDTKLTTSQNFRSIQSVSILKRKFNFSDQLNFAFAPLDLDVILELLNWDKEKDEGRKEAQAIENLNYAMMELYYHDERIFNEWADKFVSKIGELGGSVRYPNTWSSGRLSVRAGSRSNM